MTQRRPFALRYAACISCHGHGSVRIPIGRDGNPRPHPQWLQGARSFAQSSFFGRQQIVTCPACSGSGWLLVDFSARIQQPKEV